MSDQREAVPEPRGPHFSDGRPMCVACCWGDRCDEPSHYYRKDCPVCKGTGVRPTDDEADVPAPEPRLSDQDDRDVALVNDRPAHVVEDTLPLVMCRDCGAPAQYAGTGAFAGIALCGPCWLKPFAQPGSVGDEPSPDAARPHPVSVSGWVGGSPRCVSCRRPWAGWTVFPGDEFKVTKVCRDVPLPDGTWTTHPFVEADHA